MRLLAALLAVLAAFAAQAFAQDQAYETAARQMILIDDRTGAIFLEKNADELIAPASMSKLMTMIMVFEAVKAGNLSWDQEFLISEDAWRRGGAQSGGSTMYAELNSRVKLRDLVQGAIIQSANDACIAIAEGMAGSEAVFAEMMTKRARELGLKQAVFKNATGLPDPDHRMSVRELSILAGHIIRAFPDEFTFYGQREFEWNKIRQQNRNPLLLDYPGADGMKTGYTKEAGYGLVGTAQRDGRRLIMVVAGLDTLQARKQEAQKLLDWGFGQFKPVDVFAGGDIVAEARVWGGEKRWIPLRAPDAGARILLSPQEQRSVEMKLSYKGPMLAPVKAGTPAGSVRLIALGKVLAEYPVTAGEDVSAIDSMWLKAWDSLLFVAFGG